MKVNKSVFLVMEDGSLYTFNCEETKEILITETVYEGIITKHKILNRISLNPLLKDKPNQNKSPKFPPDQIISEKETIKPPIN